MFSSKPLHSEGLHTLSIRKHGSVALWRREEPGVVLFMNRVLGIEISKKEISYLLPAHKVCLQEEKTLSSASNKSHSDDWNYREDWDSCFS